MKKKQGDEFPSWKAIGDRLQRPCYLSRVDHDTKIRSRKQKTDKGKVVPVLN
jgi:hypothetical protein